MNNIQSINVFVFNDKEPSITYDINETTTAEDVVIYISKRYGVKPITRPLFFLRVHDSKEWVNLARNLIELNARTFDFRLRFKVPNLNKLRTLDPETYNLYFHQARNDILDDQVPELKNDKHKEAILGMGVADMFRVMLETGATKEAVGKDYKKFIPKYVYNYHWFFAKNPMRKSLDTVESNISSKKKVDSWYVKSTYLTQLENLAPNYFCEEFNALVEEGNNDNRTVRIHINPYDNEFPGIKFIYDNHKEWVHVCSIEDLCVISLRVIDRSMEVLRKTGIPVYFKFFSDETMFSMVSLLDGYYRLGVNWKFSLSKDVQTPSLEKLHLLKCHGPVGGEFSYSKLKRLRSNKPGCYILRESDLVYDQYYIDVCTESSPTTYKIERRVDGGFYFNEEEHRYESIEKLLLKLRSPESSVKLVECLPPSEYDVSPLLLCRIEKTKFKDDEEDLPRGLPSAAQFIHFKELLLYKGKNKMHKGSMSDVFQGAWQRKKRRQVDIALKVFKSECHSTEEQLELMSQWASVQSPVLVKLYGLSLNSPLGMVMELLPLGPLDAYLQQKSSEVKEVDLVEAANYLATALWNLQEAGMVHGNVRCHKLLVAAHTDTSFVVRLADPGPPRPYTNNDIHWLAPECYFLPNNSRKTTTSDIWAFGTTLWEIFSMGQQPSLTEENLKQYYISGKRLPQPENSSEEIFLLMKQCWSLDPQRRKTTQEALRDTNHLLYQVFNSRRCNTYSVPQIPDSKGNNSFSFMVTSENSTITSDLTIESGGAPMGNGRLWAEEDTWPFASSEKAEVILEMNELDDPPLIQSPEELSNVISYLACDPGANLDSVSDINCMFELDNRWKLVLLFRIGKGNYGEVFKASLEQLDNNGEEPLTVAVKRLHANGMGNVSQDFLHEINIMKRLKHENIVQIKAVIEDPEVNLVMEFFHHGSLESYLKVNRDWLKPQHLLKFSLDIANGMKYLGDKKIVHRDLAARNILVANESHVKISDFGLAQVLGPNSDYYILKTCRDIPIKWYAPESLRDNKFSPRTDMWSYGVTLFEIFSFSQDPLLPTLKENSLNQTLLLADLEKGVRLPQPLTCPQEIYTSLIYPCWKLNPRDRPTFLQVAKTVQQLIATYLSNPP